MPYLKFTTTDNKQVEIGGNKFDEFNTKISANASLAAKPQAIEYVKKFFERRTLQVQRQKALLINDTADAERIDNLLDDAEDSEDAAKQQYDSAVKAELSGQVNNISLDSATINGASSQTSTNSSAAATAGSSTASNAYGDIAPTEQAGNDDDFM